MLTSPQERAEAAIKTITQADQPPQTPGQLKFLTLDLNDLTSVKSAAASFARQESKLDVLWNNAGQGGYSLPVGAKTVQGLEAFVGAHCVATLLFTELLLPQLRAAVATASAPGSVRVVWTSSFLAEKATPRGGVEFEHLAEGTADAVRNYGVSKLGGWMLAREAARRHGGEGIVSVAQNPGNLNSNVYAGMSPFLKFFVRLVLYHPRFGAYTELYAGLSPDVSLENNGAYVIPWGRIQADADFSREDIVRAITPEEDGGLGYDKKFWDWCEQQWKPFV